MPTLILIILTVAVAVLVGVSINQLSPERLSAFGDILSGAGGILAVIWFSAGLRYQSRQLDEQRRQFAAQFQHLQEASKRDALLLAKGILENAEQKAIAHHGSITAVNEIFVEYMNISELTPILESTDPHEVLRAHQLWMKKEGAALALLSGVKSAAEVYLRSIGANDIDYTKSPEEFYFIYGPRFSSQPFFYNLSGTATLLSEFMVMLSPGRNAATIAFLSANAKIISAEVIRMDMLREDIARHVAAGHSLPAIADGI